jgi:hypothetical protein
VTGRDARIEAIGRMDDWDFAGAADKLAPCLYVGDERDRFLCQDMLGGIRLRQHAWGAAATAYRFAFEIRDRIAKARGYGSPSNESLASWGFALLRIGDRAKAKVVFARVELGRGDWHPYENAAMAARVNMAHDDGDAATEQRLRAAFDACDTRDVDHFDPKLRNVITVAYLPADGWIAMGDACQGPERRSFYERALSVAVAEKDQDTQNICVARITNNGP